MSLWTPSGEHPVDRRGSSDSGEAEPASSGTAPPGADQGAAAGVGAEVGEAPDAAPGGAVGAVDIDEDGPSLEDLSPEQRAQVEAMARQMQEAQDRMLRAPAGTVIGQHALQFYELGALYLSQEPPRLDDARAAIDGFAAVIERLGDRLGEAHPPLRQALNQIQLAYVQVANKTQPTSP